MRAQAAYPALDLPFQNCPKTLGRRRRRRTYLGLCYSLCWSENYTPESISSGVPWCSLVLASVRITRRRVDRNVLKDMPESGPKCP
jgi:hypothetical protein